MRRIILGLAFLTLAFFSHQKADAACTVALTFTTGQTLTAPVLNANPVNEVNCINNVSINASQVSPISLAAAIFGGPYQYQFNNGLGIDGNLSIVPASDGTSSNVVLNNAADSQGLVSLDDVSSTRGAVHVGNNTIAGYLPPFYTPSGASLANTLHGVVVASFSITGLPNPCSGNSGCGAASGPSFSGAAAFASSSSYACMASVNGSGSAVKVDWTYTSGTATQLNVNNTSSSNVNPNVAISYICIGT